MAFKLNWVGCVWRTASMGYLKRGRELGYLVVGNGGGGGGGGVKQLISSSSSCSSPSSWSLLSRGITINSSSPCACACINHPLVSSTAPCLLIPSPPPSPKDKDGEHDEGIAATAIAKEAGTGTGTGEVPGYCLYSLADRKMVSLNNNLHNVIPDHAICIGSSHGWLAYIDPHDGALFITNPVDMKTSVPSTIRLPPLDTIPRTMARPFARLEYPFIEKFVMSSAPSSSSENKDCTVVVMVMVILSNDRGRAFCKLGDSSWTLLEYPVNCFLVDLAYSSKDRLFYGLTNEPLKLEALNLRNPCSPRLIDIKTDLNIISEDWEMPHYTQSEMELKLEQSNDVVPYTKEYLVMEPCSGDVLLVTRISAIIAEDGTFIADWLVKDEDRDALRPKTYDFEVSRLNAAYRGWEEVTDLGDGDGVVFLGLNQSFMLSASDFPPGVLIPNSIYFTPERCEEFRDMGIYNMTDFTVTPLFPSHLHPFNNIQKPPPTWFTPNPWNN